MCSKSFKLMIFSEIDKVKVEARLTTSTEVQLKTLKNHTKFKNPTDTRHIYSSNHQTWLSYQILGGKTVKNDPQTTEIL